MTKVSLEDFCVAWNTNKGDLQKIQEQIGTTENNLKSRYAKYKKLGINLCDPILPQRKRKTVVDSVDKINKLLEGIN